MRVPTQPEINIGTIGHVDHGKTTLVEALSGEWTDRHSEELKRGISIKLGYADAAFYKCGNADHEGPEAYTNEPKCPLDGDETELLRCVSFVDSPGHETLMAIMISGAAIMDGALLIIGANEACPQPQTKEHFMAAQLIGLERFLVVQNKIDLVDDKRAEESYQEIQDFIEGTPAEGAPIVPISAQHRANVDLVIQAIEEQLPTPDRDLSADPRMYVARSFDINKPGTPAKDLRGGVIGGSLAEGRLEIGDEIEVVPGRKVEEGGKVHMEPIVSEVTGLMAGGDARDEVGPGGLVAVGTKLDPALTKSDALVGKVLGRPGALPPTLESFTMETNLMERVVGTEEETEVEPIRTNEPLMLNIGTATTVGVVTSARSDEADVDLKLRVAANPGQRVAISRRIATRWRLIGYGIIQ